MNGTDFEAGAIIPVDKPAGLTSFTVVRLIRKWTGCKKVGHAGTLDPFATGLLLICTGKATKRSAELMLFEKTYEATITLGQKTTTDDPEGEIVATRPVPIFPETEICECLNTFTGVIEQVPPIFSALKKDGKPLYRYARKGVPVTLEPRKVQIHEIELLGWQLPDLSIRVRCGKGTYIRALARDVGERLGTGGSLKSLRRTQIGPYRVDDAVTLDMFRQQMGIDASPKIT